MFVTSLRPGAAERLGLGPDDVPARIYCRIDAYGPGPLGDEPGLRPADAGVRRPPLGHGRARRRDRSRRRVAGRLRDGVVGGDRDPLRAADGRAARGRGLALRDRARARRLPRRRRARRRRAGQARLRVPAHRAVSGVRDARRRGHARRGERPVVHRARATTRAPRRRPLRDERVARRAPRGARRARAGTPRARSRRLSGSSGSRESRSRPCRRSARPRSTRTRVRSGSCRRSTGASGSQSRCESTASASGWTRRRPRWVSPTGRPGPGARGRAIPPATAPRARARPGRRPSRCRRLRAGRRDPRSRCSPSRAERTGSRRGRRPTRPGRWRRASSAATAFA